MQTEKHDSRLDHAAAHSLILKITARFIVARLRDASLQATHYIRGLEQTTHQALCRIIL
jgi:hypothetical protein